MKLIQCSLERNFHVSNDDRFLLEKASLVAQIEDEEDEQVVLNQLRERLAYNFKNAYPKIEMSINFEYARKEFPIKTSSGIWDIKPTPTPNEQLEYQLDKSFNLVEEINKCKKKNLLKVYEPMCKTEEEKIALSDKLKELTV